MKGIIKEINKITLGKDDFLFIRLPEDTEVDVLSGIKRQMKEFLGPEKAEKVLLFAGDVKLDLVTMKEFKNAQASS